MEDSLRKEIAIILEEIKDATWEEDYDDVIQRFKDIPDVYWKDAACFSKIIEWILPTANDELVIYPIDAIPNWFWEDKSNVLNYYFNDLWEFYAEDRVHFNLCELIPMSLLNDPECARLLLECNVDETLSYMSENLIAVPEIALSALRGVWLKIEWRNDNCTSWLPPFNERDCLNEFFEEIPKTLASSKDFILGFIDSGYFTGNIACDIAKFVKFFVISVCNNSAILKGYRRIFDNCAIYKIFYIFQKVDIITKFSKKRRTDLA
jgi:hypothetical protein